MSGASTLAAFKWKFRDGARIAVDAHSPAGGIEAIDRVLRELEILDMPIGPGVSFRNLYDLRTLPTGTVFSQDRPENTAYYNVWVMKGGSMRSLLGGGSTRRSHPFTIIEMPGRDRPSWLDQEPVEDEAALIEAWKKTAWKVAYTAKIRHQWCGDFERVMYSLDVHGE